MKRLLIASNNEGKINEIREVFSDLNYEIISLKDAGLDITIVEDQPDFAGNSFKKAYEVSKKTGEIVLADDSGLEVEVLGNKPGVYSSRFAGEYATDEENNEKLLLLMKEIPLERRKARFRCVCPGKTLKCNCCNSEYWEIPLIPQLQLDTLPDPQKSDQNTLSILRLSPGQDSAAGDCMLDY